MRAIVDAPLRPPPRTWGGKRAGAGRPRKPTRARTSVAHAARPIHKKRHPVHITLRAQTGLPSFRHDLVEKMLKGVLLQQPFRAYRDGFQVVHYSIQSNHLHLIVEANDKRTMRSGVSGLVIAFAKRMNKLLGRRTGKTWGERYHRRDLATPSEVRNALVYVLHNFKKHGATTHGPVVDHYSSALRFPGWSIPVGSRPDPDPFPARAPRTWLLGTGYALRRGPIWPDEHPAASPKM